MQIIKTSALCHVYSQGTPFEHIAVDGIDAEINEGELIGIIGRTGSGKSTFIQHLNGLLAPSSGTVFVEGTDINSSKERLHNVRFTVGLVFQYPEYQLFEETVYKDMSFGPKNMGLSEEEIHKNVVEAAFHAGVGEELFELSPLELSGGQKRRVAIAGVMAMRPRVLILDEPTAGLDPETREKILFEIAEYRRSTGATVILISHSMDDIAAIADRLLVFSDGKIVMDGSPAEIFGRASELKELGLTIPAATELSLLLAERGVAISDSIYTLKYLGKQLIALKKGGTADA